MSDRARTDKDLSSAVKSREKSKLLAQPLLYCSLFHRSWAPPSLVAELSLLPLVGPQFRTTLTTIVSSDVIVFTTLLLYLLIVFSFSAWIAFRARTQSFTTISARFISFWVSMQGENLQDSFGTGANNRLLGLIFYVAFRTSLVFCFPIFL